MGGFKKGHDPNRKIFSKEDRIQAIIIRKKNREARYSLASFDELPLTEKRKVVLREQDNKCLCGINDWLGSPLSLELDHIDVIIKII